VSFRDPDLGRDRTTLALGRRDWGFFVDVDGLTPADRQAAEEPWGPGRAITFHDRFDRTWGIPDRSVPMWPAAPLALHGVVDPVVRAEAICDDICARPMPEWRWPQAEAAVALLVEAAADLHDRHPDSQAAILAAAARRHGVEAHVAWDLASGVGALVAQTTHSRPARMAGVPSLNALAGGDLATAVPLFLARDRLRLADRLSDPDLPRLWVLANGLAHGVPADVMRRVPAHSAGPLMEGLERRREEGRAQDRLDIEVHDDLVGWDGVRPAVEHLRDAVRAAGEGRQWLASVARGDLEERVLGLGVVALTRPDTAMELARFGVGRLDFDQLGSVAGPAPHGVLDLSDSALKAVCDRNGWLLGFAGERTQQELVERESAAADRDTLQAALIDGDPAALASLADLAPPDHALDAGVFRKNPPAPDAVAAQRVVTEGGREALRRFAGVEPPRRASVAEAVAHRFPRRPSRDLLCESEPDRLLGKGMPAPRPPAAVPLTLDLGM
jgi:hypothetical protein